MAFVIFVIVFALQVQCTCMTPEQFAHLHRYQYSQGSSRPDLSKYSFDQDDLLVITTVQAIKSGGSTQYSTTTARDPAGLTSVSTALIRMTLVSTAFIRMTYNNSTSTKKWRVYVRLHSIVPVQPGIESAEPQ